MFLVILFFSWIALSFLSFQNLWQKTLNIFINNTFVLPKGITFSKTFLVKRFGILNLYVLEITRVVSISHSKLLEI